MIRRTKSRHQDALDKFKGLVQGVRQATKVLNQDADPNKPSNTKGRAWSTREKPPPSTKHQPEPSDKDSVAKSDDVAPLHEVAQVHVLDGARDILTSAKESLPWPGVLAVDVLADIVDLAQVALIHHGQVCELARRALALLEMLAHYSGGGALHQETRYRRVVDELLDAFAKLRELLEELRSDRFMLLLLAEERMEAEERSIVRLARLLRLLAAGLAPPQGQPMPLRARDCLALLTRPLPGAQQGEGTRLHVMLSRMGGPAAAASSAEQLAALRQELPGPGPRLNIVKLERALVVAAVAQGGGPAGVLRNEQLAAFWLRAGLGWEMLWEELWAALGQRLGATPLEGEEALQMAALLANEDARRRFRKQVERRSARLVTVAQLADAAPPLVPLTQVILSFVQPTRTLPDSPSAATAAPAAACPLPPVCSAFCGRSDDVRLLAGLLERAGETGQAGTAGQVVCLYGDPGVGRTQVALAVCWRLWQSGWAAGGVALVDLRMCSGADDMLAQFYDMLGLEQEHSNRTPLRVVSELRNLASVHRFLLLVDNADDADQAANIALSQLIGLIASQLSHVFVLLTARAPLVGSAAAGAVVNQQLSALTLTHGAALLQRLAPHTHMEDAAPLAAACGRSPLLLRLAAAALVRGDALPQDLTEQLLNAKREEGSGTSAGGGAAAASTPAVSIAAGWKRAARAGGAAVGGAQTLRHASSMSRKEAADSQASAVAASQLRVLLAGVPAWHLNSLAALSVFPGPVDEGAAAAVLRLQLPEARAALSCLARQGLLEHDPRANKYSMHLALLALCRRQLAASGELLSAAKAFVEHTLTRVMPAGDAWEADARVVALQLGAAYHHELLETFRLIRATRGAALGATGLQRLLRLQPLLTALHLIASAEFGDMCAAAAAAARGSDGAGGREEGGGDGNEAAAAALQLLGASLESRELLGDAAAALRDAVQAQTAAWGPDDPGLVTALRRLGAVLTQQGQQQEAEQVLRRALALLTSSSGPSTREAAEVLAQLAGVMTAQGRPDQALEHWRSALAAHRAVATAATPGRQDKEAGETGGGGSAKHSLPRAGSVNSSTKAGDLAGAMGSLSTAAVVGGGPAELACVMGAAGALEALHRLNESEFLYRQAVEGWRAEAGPQALQLAEPLHGLARVVQAQGRLGDAEQAYRQALLVQLQSGTEEGVATALDRLASVLTQQEKHGDAEHTLRQALEVRTRLLGASDPELVPTMCQLADSLAAQCRYAAAEELTRRALVIRQANGGEDDPATAQVIASVAALASAQGRYVEAEDLQRRVYECRAASLGVDHLSVAAALADWASAVEARGRHADAEELYRRCLEMRTRALGGDHPDTAAALAAVAGTLDAQGRSADAEQLYRSALAVQVRALGPKHAAVASTTNDLALCLDSQGRYEHAAGLLRDALQLRETLLGRSHPAVAATINNLAGVLDALGSSEEAEALYLEALHTRARVLGPTHPLVAQSLNNLGCAMAARGRHSEAERHLRAALELRLRALGEEHPAVAASMDSLAVALDVQGASVQAEQLYVKALEVRRAVLGARHPLVLASQHNVARTARLQGRLEEAEAGFRAVLVLRRAALGPEHPHTASTLEALADTLRARGELQEAEALGREALALRLRVMGPEHPDVASSLAGVALVLAAQGQYVEAERLATEALELRIRRMGVNHPDVAATMCHVAGTLTAQGRYSEAEGLYRSALAVLGGSELAGDHPLVAAASNDLAGTLAVQGNLEEAEAMQRGVLELQLRRCGLEHPDVATALNNLAGMLSARGDNQEAAETYGAALDLRLKLLGAEHPLVAQSLNNLAGALRRGGDVDGALPLYRRALEMRLRTLGPDHPDVADSLNSLAGALASQGRLEVAERMFRSALELRQRQLGEEHPDVAATTANLAAALQAQDRLEEAEPLFERALQLRVRALGEEHPLVAASLYSLAGLQAARDKGEAAEHNYRTALQLRVRVMGLEHPVVLETLAALLKHLQSMGKSPEVERIALVAQHTQRPAMPLQYSSGLLSERESGGGSVAGSVGSGGVTPTRLMRGVMTGTAALARGFGSFRKSFNSRGSEATDAIPSGVIAPSASMSSNGLHTPKVSL